MRTGQPSAFVAFSIGLIAWCVASVGQSSAYDLITHAKVSEQAFDISKRVRGYLEDLGIELQRVFERDDPGVGRTARESAEFAEYENDGTARGWFAAGSIREDDYRESVIASLAGCDAPRNPPSPINRPFNHFFHVQGDGRGLIVPGGSFPAPDWALGLQGRGPAPTQNQFSILDARQYQLDSLKAETKAERDQKTALMFRTLGHAAHVLADMGQPQHTRDDPHPACDRFQLLLGSRSWYEKYVDTRAKREEFRSRGVPSPALVLGGYDPVSLSAYRDFWQNTSRSGLADFSSRNFFSAGTNLSGCGGLNVPPCNVTELTADPTNFTVRLLDGSLVSGRVTLYRRDIPDPATGAVIPGVAVTSRSIWDEHLESDNHPPSFTLNTLNYDSMANTLLPRTAGYAAGLLDYFFRGRLDVEAVADPVDPTLVRLRGKNASSERLVDGTLTLYADTPSGERAAATALGPVSLSDVGPSGDITSAQFRVPADAETLTAVYRGTLGAEAKDPDRNVPGGVIGKVLGGVRVEEIFSASNQWKMRSPKGVFTLTDAGQPLSASVYEEVRWGDGDNMIVARRPLDASTNEHLVVFDVPRRAGSVDAVVEPSTLSVPLARRPAVPFPFDTVVTTIHASLTVDYRQRLARTDFKRTYTWVEDEAEAHNFYAPPKDDYPPYSFEIAHEETVPFIGTVPIVLDRDHNLSVGFLGDPYSWDLQETFVDAQGRILGLVVVYLGSAPSGVVPVFSVNALTGDLVQVADRIVTPYFPAQVNPLLWALVDLGAGTVVASTAGADVAISYRRVEEFELQNSFWVHLTETYEGGDQNGTHDRGWSRAASIDYRRFNGTLGTVTDVRFSAVGEQDTAIDGWLRNDLLQAVIGRGLYSVQPTDVPNGTEFVYYCDTSKVCSAMVIDEAVGTVVQDPGQFWQARRARPVTGNERLVLLSLRFVFNPVSASGDLGNVLVWDPATPRAQFVGPQLAIGFHDLGSAVGGQALVSSTRADTGDLTTWLFKLDGSSPLAFPDVDLTGAYVLLEPGYLYNTDDLKFHRVQPSLERSALPAALADVSGNPSGDYHAIRVIPAASN